MLSIALTNYNRYDFLIESFAPVINDSRVSEIVISDDCSDLEIYDRLHDYFIGYEKVKLFRNERNVGMSRNKAIAVELATNNIVALIDSDNVITSSYIDALFANGQLMTDKVINVPAFAQPNFDFRKYAGTFIRTKEAKENMNDSIFRVMLNCCNYVVPRQTYIDVYEYNSEMKGTDTIYMNYLWLKKGYSFYVVPGMEYFHRVGSHSGFLQDMAYNMQKAKEIENKILQL